MYAVVREIEQLLFLVQNFHFLNVPYCCRNDSSQSAIRPLLFIGQIILLELSLYLKLKLKRKFFVFTAAATLDATLRRPAGRILGVCAASAF